MVDLPTGLWKGRLIHVAAPPAARRAVLNRRLDPRQTRLHQKLGRPDPNGRTFDSTTTQRGLERCRKVQMNRFFCHDQRVSLALGDPDVMWPTERVKGASDRRF